MRELGLVVKITKEIEPVLERVARFGFPTCQISTYVPEVYTNENAERINAFCRNNRIRVSQLWAGWPGKCEWDFVGGPETVGLVPLAYRKERCEIVKKASDFAVRIGVDSVATHAGFIPENPRDPLYARLVEDLRDAGPALTRTEVWPSAQHLDAAHFGLEQGQDARTCRRTASRSASCTRPASRPGS